MAALNLGFIALFDHSYKVVFEFGALLKVGGCLEATHEAATFSRYTVYTLNFLKNHHQVTICFKTRKANFNQSAAKMIQGYNVVGRTICRLLDTENEVRYVMVT